MESFVGLLFVLAVLVGVWRTVANWRGVSIYHRAIRHALGASLGFLAAVVSLLLVIEGMPWIVGGIAIIALWAAFIRKPLPEEPLPPSGIYLEELLQREERELFDDVDDDLTRDR